MKKESSMKKRNGLLLVMVLIVVLLAGCANKAAEKGKAEDKDSDKSKRVYGVTYWIESDYFKTMADSLTECAEADGATTIVVDAAQDTTKQIQIIEDFIARDVDAVFLNPVDKEAVEPGLRKLKEANIPVINFDAAVKNMDLVDAFVATDNKQAGELCGEAIVKDFPDGGKIAVLNFPANSAGLEREEGFLEVIEGKGFEIVATFDAEGTVELGQEIMSDILQAHPDVDAVFGINDQCAMGAYAAITTAGKDVSIYGVDGNPEAKKVISQNGIYKMSAAQSPIKMGQESYRIAKSILDGDDSVEDRVEIPAFTIDNSNIQDYLDQEWQ